MSTREPDPGRLAAKLRKELLSGSTSLVLLAHLAASRRARYGWEIARELERAGGGLDLRAGTLYPALRSLEREGLLESELRPSAAGPPRKYYRITRAGRRVLREWVGTWTAVRGLVDESLRGVAG